MSVTLEKPQDPKETGNEEELRLALRRQERAMVPQSRRGRAKEDRDGRSPND